MSLVVEADTPFVVDFAVERQGAGFDTRTPGCFVRPRDRGHEFVLPGAWQGYLVFSEGRMTRPLVPVSRGTRVVTLSLG